MWKKEDAKLQGASSNPISTTNVASPAAAFSNPSTSASLSASPRAAACISQGIRIKGEVTGTEDLFVDGLVEGKLNLTASSCLTVGPNGNVKADLNAREIIVRGKVEGKVTARDKLHIGSTGEITGEVQTDRLAIEDGAMLRGKVEAGRQPNKLADTKAAAAGSSKASDSLSMSPGTVAD
jgi:cytoskeletal protein CcmA (bactofilin family)